MEIVVGHLPILEAMGPRNEGGNYPSTKEIMEEILALHWLCGETTKINTTHILHSHSN